MIFSGSETKYTWLDLMYADTYVYLSSFDFLVWD